MRIKQIKYVSPIEEANPENDNIDVHVYLDDGRIYSFIVATPNNIYWCMDNEEIDYFFGFPPVFVKLLTTDNIEKALNAIFAERTKWLGVYGTLQSGMATQDIEESSESRQR
jgi:uncharacterized membrane protein YpjA